MDRDETWWQFKDTLRSAFYAMAPIIVIATVWSVGWAKAVESQINAQNAAAGTVVGGQLVNLPAERTTHDNPVASFDQLADLRAGND